MTYEQLCDRYRNFKGDRAIKAQWGHYIPLASNASLGIWLPTNGSFEVTEGVNIIYINWSPDAPK